MVRENTLRKTEQDGFDDYYAALYSKDGYSLRDIYPEACKKFIIMPDDPFKTKWEIIISLILIFTAVTTPYRIAFVDTDSLGWVVVNYIIDSCFFIDIIMCFVTGIEDENEELIHDRWLLAKSYMLSWFFIDVVSIIPLSEVL